MITGDNLLVVRQRFFSNRGAEAVEASLKLARHAIRRSNMNAFQGGYHGRTVARMSLVTSNPIYCIGYQPLIVGVFVAPFPNDNYYGLSEDETTNSCMKQLRCFLMTQTAPEETAVILIEPVLGEGDYVLSPAGFLAGVQ
jgi:4-aminobutyrate aminotransferase